MAQKLSTKSIKHPISRIVAWVITISGTIGLFASFMLTLENFHHLKNPGQSLACDLNPLIGCGSILDTWQGSVLFHIPNEIFGLIACTVLVTLGVLLLARVNFPRWIWRGLQAGVLLGTLVVIWFLYQSLFVLNHLCPYCMVTWAAILPVAWYVTVYNLEQRHCAFVCKIEGFRALAIKHHLDIIVTIFVILIGAILLRFQDFFFG